MPLACATGIWIQPIGTVERLRPPQFPRQRPRTAILRPCCWHLVVSRKGISAKSEAGMYIGGPLFSPDSIEQVFDRCTA